MKIKPLIIQTFGFVITIILIPFIMVFKNIYKLWESSSYFKDTVYQYKRTINLYKEFYENDFDVKKINKSRQENFRKKFS